MKSSVFTLRSRGLVVLAASVALLVGVVAPIPHARADDGSDVYSPTGLFAQRVLKDEPKEEEEKEVEEKAEEAAVEIVEEPSAPRRTSPALAFLFSAGLPGTGQFYNGNRRGFAYLAVEAVAWIAHLSFRSSGNKKEDEFKDFADLHWELGRYRDSVGDPACTGSRQWNEDADSLIVYFSENNRDHYYEDIGKLEAYACGWDTQANRQEYRDLREESNDLKSWSRRALMFAFLNHLVSAVDAFRTARARELRLAPDTELKMDIGGKWNKPRATLRLVHHW
jgi:hypothetical protein